MKYVLAVLAILLASSSNAQVACYQIDRFGYTCIQIDASAFVQEAVHSDDPTQRYFDGFTDEGNIPCCGHEDCKAVDAHEVAGGYAFTFEGREYFVRQERRKPSPDDKFYACFRVDRSIRCFFAPNAGS